MQATLERNPIQEEQASHVVTPRGLTLQAEPVESCSQCSGWEDSACDCHRIKTHCKLFNAAMIPSLYLDATLKTAEMDTEASASFRRATQWTLAWARSENLPEHGLLLAGPNGVGKSFLMAALARSLTLDRGVSCLFVDFGQLLLRLKATFSGQGSEYEIYDSMHQPRILIIDDVGSFRDSTWSREVLQTIVATRYNACGKTFVTTNLFVRSGSARTLSSFEKWAGPHCASRLSEMCYWLPIDGPDRRRQRLACYR